MAATFYAQILATYRWVEIAAAIDAAIREARETIDLAPLPDDGVMVKIDGIAANATLGENDDEIIGSVYIGTVMNAVPSGRFYAPWSAVPDSVRDKDARWWEALERAAEHHGLIVVNGEGDPTDIYLYRYEPVA